jgi:predicted GIY-YIG superfamily endonuclease
MSKYKIYALLLNNNKYYIGKTKKEVIVRLYEHKMNPTNNWLKTYKPIVVKEEYESSDPFAEDNLTKKYMNNYGIDNVRGGSYTTFELENAQKKLLQKELSSLEDKCFICNKPGHYANICPEKKSIKFRNDILEDLSIKNDINEINEIKEYKIEKNDFIKLSQDYNFIIKDLKFTCDKCGTLGHSSIDCEEIKNNNNCFKCNKKGHYVYECNLKIILIKK